MESADEKTATVPGDEDIVYPGKASVAIITLALCIGTFCIGLDAAIIVVAIPKITNQFHSLDDVGWYGSAYFLTICGFQLLFGKLYAVFSTRTIFISAMLIFEVGSIVCGAAPSSVALIIGRAVLGLGAAGLYSGAAMVVRWMVPVAQRPLYLGLVGTMFGASSVVGPVLGGVFTDRLTWRWCFYINLPFGLLTAVVLLIFFHPPKQERRTNMTLSGLFRELDVLGNLLFIPAIVCLLLAFQRGGTTYPWSHWRIVLPLVMAAVLLAAFALVQVRKGDSATIPGRIFFHRDILAITWCQFCLGAAFFVGITYVPIWFQAIRGTSAVAAGIRILPILLGFVIFALIAGAGTSALGYYVPFIIISSVLIAVGGGLLTTLTAQSPASRWIGYQVIFGAGIGLGMQMGMVVAQTILRGSDIAIGTALQTFSQNLGGALFVTIGQTIFENKLITNLEHGFPDVPYIKDTVHRSGITQIAERILTMNPSRFPFMIALYNDSLTRVFYICAAFGAASIFGALALRWVNVKKQTDT